MNFPRLLICAICAPLAFLGCGSENVEPVQPEPTSVRPAVSLCAQGAVDPTDSEISAAAGQLGGLIARYPESAKIRVLAAGAALYSTPNNIAEAHRLYGEAKALADAGCTLGSRDQWLLAEGDALAFMMEQQHASALPIYQSAVERFPNVSSTRYNLACAYCMTGDLEQCLSSFVQTLEMTAAGRHPAWTSEPDRTVGHYVSLSARDSDVARLRADPRYQEAIAPYVGRP